MEKSQEQTNLSVDEGYLNVRCFGLGVATVLPGTKCLANILPDITDCNPDIIFLHIGENDVANGKPAAAIAEVIVNITSHLLNVAKRLIVGQLLPFPSLQRQKTTVIAVNKLLESTLAGMPSVKYWRHQNGFWKPVTSSMTGHQRKPLFHVDGVHLTEEGMNRYHNSVKVAVCKAAASLKHVGRSVSLMNFDASSRKMIELSVVGDDGTDPL